MAFHFILRKFTALDFLKIRGNVLPMDTSFPPPLPPKSNGPDSRQWITILHLSALAGLVIVGFGHILGPLIVWLLKRNDVAGLDAEGKNVLNFQISWSLWFALVCLIAAVGSCLIVPLALPVIFTIIWLIYLIIGAVKASDGVSYKFPLTIRFL